MVKENFYAGNGYGSNYGLSQTYASGGTDPNFVGYTVNAGQIGFPTDPRTANQLQATSNKLNTGAKVVEISGVHIGQGDPLTNIDSIPKEHWKEIERLKKLTGTELTFHGPLVEASGMERGRPFEEIGRLQAERQMWRAIESAHQVEPGSNIPVVFHSSNIGAPLETTHKLKSGKEEVADVIVIDEHTGQLRRVSSATFTKDYLKGGKLDVYKGIKKQNEEEWTNQLAGLSFSTYQAKDILNRSLEKIKIKGGENDKKGYLDFYREYVKNPAKAQKIINQIPEDQREIVQENINEIVHGETYLRGQYKNFKDLYNKAYSVAEESNNEKDKRLLEDYRKKISSKISAYEEDPSKILDFSQAMIEGIDVLRKIDPPQALRPAKDFIIDKSADTYSNLALRAYQKWGADKSPIIAIENPPADEFALSRASELKQLVEKSRDRFVKKAKSELGLSEKQAKKYADRLIGITWDTGHINNLQGRGYTKQDVIKEAETIAPYVKHVHVVDNFGTSDTELPPGMGTAPIKESLERIGKWNKNAKKIIETGAWYSALQQRGTPLQQSFAGLGSPIYAMKMAPTWSQVSSTYGSYFAGYGRMLPEQHFNTYGAGFSNIPPELGGQMAGQSRVSGAPIE